MTPDSCGVIYGHQYLWQSWSVVRRGSRYGIRQHGVRPWVVGGSWDSEGAAVAFIGVMQRQALTELYRRIGWRSGP